VSKWLTTARNYWVRTVRRDGPRHAKPAWVVWLEGKLVFSTHPKTLTAPQASRRPSYTATAAMQVVIVSKEGHGHEGSTVGRCLPRFGAA
jgi:hypothetical protein